MRAVEIHDGESLRAWLEARREGVRLQEALTVAQRSALRVSAIWLKDFYQSRRQSYLLYSLPVLRALLAANVSGRFSDIEVREATEAAELLCEDVRASYDALNSFGEAKLDERAAADSIRYAIGAADTKGAAYAVSAAAYSVGRIGKWDATQWREVGYDAATLEEGRDPHATPLWNGRQPPQLVKEENAWLERLATETGDRNSFWHRWWFSMKRGEPMDWALQRDVALIPEEIWAQGAKAVGVEIAKIEARYKRPPPADVLDLAHTDFTYDALRQWMRMVPFEQDISRLRDPVVLGRLQDASGDLRTVLETLQTAAEAAGRQSANEVKAIAGPIFKELDRVTSHQELRVGVLIDLGETLQFASGNEDIRMGLGPILPRLMDRASDRLLDLLRAYFAPSMVRTAPLREIVLHADESPRAIVDMARKTLAILQDYDGSVIPPLNPEDLEVLEHLNDALARAWLLFEAANSTEIKVELGNSFARKAFQLAVDKARYVKRGYDQVNAAIGGKDNDTADAMLRRIQLFHTATEIGQWLLELLKLMTGG